MQKLTQTIHPIGATLLLPIFAVEPPRDPQARISLGVDLSDNGAGAGNMAQVIPSRMTAEIEGDFVVFLIGMRVNKPWMIHKWLPVLLAMPRMLKELEAHPESGFLGHIQSVGVIVQYWRSFEHLEAYARSRDQQHWPVWMAFNKRIGKSRGEVGIWHETYQVRAGEYETVYSGMPPYGLGKVGKLVPASGGRDSARGRFLRTR